MDFLGSKRALTTFLTHTVDRLGPSVGHAVDLFCGTAAVSTILRARGWRVTANDNLRLCSTFAEAALLFPVGPSFSGLGAPTYSAVIEELNSLRPQPGFIHAHYSPAGRRMYLTEANAARVDAIRNQIRIWESVLSLGERARLLADLVTAVSRVSNTAGTYGCYLKHWKPRAEAPLTLVETSVNAEPSRDHAVYCADAQKVASQLTACVVYADPPYTKRQYAAYYHLLETIVAGDEPELVGSTGLRPWRGQASDWSYLRRAPDALQTLVETVDCQHFLLSYSEDGHISDPVIREILAAHGRVDVRETGYQRYRSNSRPHKGPTVRERLYHLQMN